MAQISTALLVYRLLVAAIAILGPTVLFLGLWRFLEVLKDDRLIDRLATHGVIEQPKPAPVDFLDELPGASGNRCEGCGAQNIPQATHCRNCARSLE